MDHQERTEAAPLLNPDDDHADRQQIPWWRKALTYSLVTLIPVLMALAQPVFLILLPITLVPTAVCYWIYHSATQHDTSNRLGFSNLLKIYLSFGVIGLVVVAIVSSILSYVLAYALFRSEAQTYLEEFGRSETQVELAEPDVIARRAQMASRWQYWVFLLLLMFVVVAITEELLKYMSLPIALRYFIPRTTTVIDTEMTKTTTKLELNTQDHNTDNSPTIYYIPIVVTAALGFGTIENIGFLYAASITAAEPVKRLALTVCERIMISGPAHVLTALMIGINAIESADRRGDGGSNTFLDVVKILTVPILFHGSFDFILLAVSASDGNIGWVHPRRGWTLWAALTAVLALELALGLVVWRSWVRVGVRL